MLTSVKAKENSAWEARRHKITSCVVRETEKSQTLLEEKCESRSFVMAPHCYCEHTSEIRRPKKECSLNAGISVALDYL